MTINTITSTIFTRLKNKYSNIYQLDDNTKLMIEDKIFEFSIKKDVLIIVTNAEIVYQIRAEYVLIDHIINIIEKELN